MKTVLVLTDFSYAAFNAARYALMLAGGDTGNCRVILCHSIVFNLVLSNGEVSGPINISRNKLEELQISLEPFKPPNTIIERRVEHQELTHAIADILNGESIDLVVAGGKGKSAGQLFLGRNLVNLISAVRSPLLVVPEEAIYEPIQAAILACDLDDVEKIPVNLIRNFIQPLHCKLHILNVDHRNRERIYIEKLIQQNTLDELFKEEHPKYHNISYNGAAEGIHHFCNLYNEALLIIVHKKHGFFHNMIHGSIAKKLSVDTSIPILIVRETD